MNSAGSIGCVRAAAAWRSSEHWSLTSQLTQTQRGLRRSSLRLQKSVIEKKKKYNSFTSSHGLYLFH